MLPGPPQSERWTEIGSTVPRLGAKILRGYVKDENIKINSAINGMYRANNMYFPFASPVIHVNMQTMDGRTDGQNYSLDFNTIWNSRSTLQNFGAIIFD